MALQKHGQYKNIDKNLEFYLNCGIRSKKNYSYQQAGAELKHSAWKVLNEHNFVNPKLINPIQGVPELTIQGGGAKTPTLHILAISQSFQVGFK